MFQKTTLPLHAAPSEVSSGKQRSSLTLADIQSDSIAQIAEKHFGSWNPRVVESIFKDELEPSLFSSRKLLLLEYYRYLEKFLWPNYDDNASLNHVLSICLIVNEKARQNIALWDAFESDASKFTSFFQRVIHLTTDNQLPIILRRQLIVFLIQCFQSFENSFVRAECLKLVTIGIWSHLAHQGKRQQLFSDYPALEKLWKLSNKKMVAADEATRKQIEFERDFLSTLMRDYLSLLYRISTDGEVEQDIIRASERYLELFIDLESQLPTRRFFNTLLDDHEIVVLSQMAPCMQRLDSDVDLIKRLVERLEFYSRFEINDQTGVALTDLEMTETHCQQLIQLQHVAFRHFREEISELPLANLASIETRQDLLWHFQPLSEDVLTRLCNLLHLRSAPLDISIGINIKDFLINVLTSKYQKRSSQIEKINSQPLYPDESTLFDDNLVATQFYAGDRPLALPKLNLQFLTLFDYLLRNFTLFRLESSYEIRQDIEDAVRRIAPRLTYPDRKTEFAGWARMAVPIQDFNIVDVGEPNLGELKPSRVRADVGFDIQKYSKNIRNEWDNLRKHDVLFLLTIEATEQSSSEIKDNEDFRQHYGIKYIRGCEIVDIIGNDGRAIDEIAYSTPEQKQAKWKGTRRTLRVEMDANQYKLDMNKFNNKQTGDIHQTFNILVRREPQENNFKSVLEAIRDLMQSNLVVPDWLQKVLLGYGDPASANYKNVPDRERKVDLCDTFIDFEHLKTCFEGKNLQISGHEPLDPPYTITLLDDPMDQDSKPTKKSKKSKQQPQKTEKSETLEVSSYTLPNMGPFPQDIPKKNQTRFTPIQAESIYSGMNHGLTVVVGPPGTGKTDIAVQTVANLYRNHPEQHTLIVTHSNQALNQIFNKIVQLDVDPRHLVRLGHGEQELDANVSFSKYGRVSAALERRILLLHQVDQLAQSISVPGEHGSTCETADYFFKIHVLPRWESFQRSTTASECVQQVRDAFPFAQYFANAPTPIFTETMSPKEAVESATGCFRHLQSIFTQLEEIRPFELLKSGYDRANYLVTKEAKVIAMTCTHAALKRRELAKLGFKYDNIIIEEAAQILEVETFIPLLLQEPKDGQNPLKRVMLIGDHHQLPPVIKNSAFQQFCNLQQSMFTRFVRLGVPTLQLDKQGRARPSIADLYNWRYQDLQNLPKVIEEPCYTKANAGFAYEYQIVQVQDYQGHGETEPVPYFYQNLGEAEYVVAVFQYMRLVGYPAEKISILTTYNGQKALIKDVLQRRCAWNPFFGAPAAIDTVDKYQGQQNDYVLLSLVRTKAVGHIRDVRRLIVAMSRAKLGLYVFCNKTLFENCYELEPVMKQFNNRPCTLQLVDNEVYPSERQADRIENLIEVANVEEMGQLVFKKSKVLQENEAEKLALEQQNGSMDTDEE
ncbi:hypothetical protein [Parasitella parasitica]|uniref:Pre-mRNA-splicing factor n=1 Tax=Parasitella parasitica TaxID=35722 RepID=A0A0B7N2I4_9FUNG|nr:hypothetical protein [Parasitella parasitica]